jgi:hypothetical protein
MVLTLRCGAGLVLLNHGIERQRYPVAYREV